MLSPMFKPSGLFFVLLLLAACSDESHLPHPADPENKNIIRIPVVVHVLYRREEFNISTAKILSQITVLNQDYRKKNSDHIKTPPEFAHLVADAEIEFELAKTDPYGKPTTGITRKETDVDGWDGRSLHNTRPVEELKLYFSEQGGQDAWRTDRYLNIWIAELSDRNGNIGGFAGYAQFPGGDARIDGVVIDPRAFGTLEPLTPAHRHGRTATHEIGHWLNLKHIFAEQNCESSDLVDDTPPTAVSYIGSPSYPQYSCGHSNMFMNFMDYVDDEAMFMFTEGQKKRMRDVFTPDGPRHSLCADCGS